LHYFSEDHYSRAGRQPSSSSAASAGPFQAAGCTLAAGRPDAALATRRLFGSGIAGAGSEFGWTLPCGIGFNSGPAAGFSASFWNVLGVVCGVASGAGLEGTGGLAAGTPQEAQPDTGAPYVTTPQPPLPHGLQLVQGL
jgi:hypothetical protein